MRSWATGWTVCPAKLVSKRNITSTTSVVYSAASTFLASLSSKTVKSSALRSVTGLPLFESITVTERRFAGRIGSAMSRSVRNLFLNSNFHSRIQSRDLRGRDLLAFFYAVGDLDVRTESISDLHLARFDRVVPDHVQL